MSHKQPRTPVQTDNSTAEGVTNNKIEPKRTKSMDIRFHWLQYRLAQAQFRFHWRPVPLNYTDYWKKHHPTAHHNNIRSELLTPKKVLDEFRSLQKKAHKGFLTCQTSREFTRVWRSHVTQWYESLMVINDMIPISIEQIIIAARSPPIQPRRW